MKPPEYVGEIRPQNTKLVADAWYGGGEGLPEEVRAALLAPAPGGDTLVDVTCSICGDVFMQVPIGTFPSPEGYDIHHLCPKHGPHEQARYIHDRMEEEDDA